MGLNALVLCYSVTLQLAFEEHVFNSNSRDYFLRVIE